MIREIGRLLVMAAGFGLLAGCIRKPQVMDGPDMMYEFASYELVGDWTEINAEKPWKLSFTRDEITCTDDAGNSSVSAFSYELDHSIDKGTLMFQTADFVFDELLFERVEIGYHKISLLFDTDGNAVKHVFVRDSDLHYIPEGYAPAPFEEEAVKTETVDQEALDAEFRKMLEGVWVTFYTEDYSGYAFAGAENLTNITFNDEGSVWLFNDGSTMKISYTLEPADNNYARTLQLYNASAFYPPYPQMEYRLKNIDGKQIPVLFGATPTDGGPADLQIDIGFVKEADLTSIPKGYRGDLANDYAAEPAVREAYAIADVSESAQWLGKTFAETGADEKYMHDGVLAFEVKLFEENVQGNAYFEDTCTKTAVQVKTMTLEECLEKLTEQYGEGKEYMTPYMGGVGAVKGYVFDRDTYVIDLHQGSEQDFVTVEFRLPE
ncbi:MAG: hypothetical protein IJ120_09165 [Solobacterium sp.]|nr:hypothetical protein [Solobacterium sp.]